MRIGKHQKRHADATKSHIVLPSEDKDMEGALVDWLIDFPYTLYMYPFLHDLLQAIDLCFDETSSGVIEGRKIPERVFPG